jgi:hypothetical protein
VRTKISPCSLVYQSPAKSNFLYEKISTSQTNMINHATPRVHVSASIPLGPTLGGGQVEGMQKLLFVRPEWLNVFISRLYNNAVHMLLQASREQFFFTNLQKNII